MNYLGDFAVGKIVRHRFNTHKADGTPITLAGSPAISVYKNSTTESTAGVTLTVNYDSRTGMHLVAIDTSADGAFYVTGENYDVVLTAGTVDSISVVGTVVASFSLENRSALRPETPDDTLNIQGGGVIVYSDALGNNVLTTNHLTSIADYVWDEALSGHTTSGTAGATLQSSGDPWATALPGSYASGTAGALLSSTYTKTLLITSEGLVSVDQQTAAMKLYVGETAVKTQYVADNLTGKTLKLYVDSIPGVPFAEFTATGGNGFFTFTPSSALVESPREFKGTLKETNNGNKVWWNNLIGVGYAAKAAS